MGYLGSRKTCKNAFDNCPNIRLDRLSCTQGYKMSKKLVLVKPKSEFAEDIKKGLTSNIKEIPSYHLYGEKGDQLFEKITLTNEYYPTRSELQILESYAFNILMHSGSDEKAPTIVELGSGNGTKTEKLLNKAVEVYGKCNYYPVDISQQSLLLLKNRLSKFEHCLISPVEANIYENLEFLPRIQSQKLILFLGSSIGNMGIDKSYSLMKRIADNMSPHDKLLIGFDLAHNGNKPQEIINRAYNDDGLVTAQFNLNLLRKINNQLGGEFDVGQFEYYSHYNPELKRQESFLKSKIKQDVRISDLNLTVRFCKDEYILTEFSQKFDLEMIAKMAGAAGLEQVDSYTDKNRYFINSLFIKT